MKGERRFLVGWDVASANDRSAITVGEIRPAEEGGRTVHHLHVGHAEVFPRGTPYPDQVDRVVGLKLGQLGDAGQALRRAPLLVDNTGLGAPVVGMLRERGLGVVPVTIVSGQGYTFHEPDRSWRVSKTSLVSSLNLLLQKGHLHLAGNLPHLEDILSELRSFRLTVTASSNVTYGAAPGAFDDLTMSLAMQAWWVASHPPADFTADSFGHIKRRNLWSGPKQGGVWRDHRKGSVWR